MIQHYNSITVCGTYKDDYVVSDGNIYYVQEPEDFTDSFVEGDTLLVIGKLTISTSWNEPDTHFIAAYQITILARASETAE